MTALPIRDLDPPRKDRRLRHNDLACGIARWRATGYGIDPNQPALQHEPRRPGGCQCHWCAGTPITSTETIRWP